MIYADFNGSAPLCDNVKDYLKDRLPSGPYSNPNAIHSLGVKVNRGMEECRSLCAEAIGTTPDKLIFNSGSSEGISQVFHSLCCDGPKGKRNIIVTSPIEHSAVKNACDYYAGKGYEIISLPVSTNGVLQLDALEELLKSHH